MTRTKQSYFEIASSASPPRNDTPNGFNQRTSLDTFFQNIAALTSVSLGALLAAAVGISHRGLCALISFAAGTLLATTVFHIAPEALDGLSFPFLIAGLISGYLLFFLVSRYVFHVCPACAASHFDEQTAAAFRNIALLLVIALGIHCVMDGIAMALGGGLDEKVDRSIFLAITIHKFPEGLALCALLIKARMDRMKALLLTLAVESLTPVGWFLGVLLMQGFEVGAWFYFLLAHIGGGFIYLALHALLNESREHSPGYVIFFFALGVGTIGFSHWMPVRGH